MIRLLASAQKHVNSKLLLVFPFNNSLQVINQYVIKTNQGAKHDNRYDVTILVFPQYPHLDLRLFRKRSDSIHPLKRDNDLMFLTVYVNC